MQEPSNNGQAITETDEIGRVVVWPPINSKKKTEAPPPKNIKDNPQEYQKQLNSELESLQRRQEYAVQMLEKQVLCCIFMNVVFSEIIFKLRAIQMQKYALHLALNGRPDNQSQQFGNEAAFVEARLSSVGFSKLYKIMPKIVLCRIFDQQQHQRYRRRAQT